MDRDGAIAAQGVADEARHDRLLEHPYLTAPDPKSLDLDDFTAAMADGLGLEDGAATLTAFTAGAVRKALNLRPQRPTRLILCGGGRRNPTVVDPIRHRARIETVMAEDVGWRGDAVEAECFAFLAVRGLRGVPISVPLTAGVAQPITGEDEFLQRQFRKIQCIDCHVPFWPLKASHRAVSVNGAAGDARNREGTCGTAPTGNLTEAWYQADTTEPRTMSPAQSLLTRLTRPTISNRRDLVRYVAFVTGFGLIAALAIDVAQQLMFFTTWASALRSWAVTVAAVTVIATPVATMFARAQWELQRAKDALEDLSRTDPLTGLPNRRALMEASEAPTLRTMVLVIADIDRFKAVNDTYGHRAGDAVLQAVGRIMTQRLASYGLVGRLGGEEFALISSHASLGQIIAALGDLLRAIETTPFVTPGGAVRITMSAGVAIRHPSEPFERLYSEADEALYLAKRSGRNRIELSARAREALPTDQQADHPRMA